MSTIWPEEDKQIPEQIGETMVPEVLHRLCRFNEDVYGRMRRGRLI